MQLKEKENDEDYIAPSGEMVCDVERIPDDPGEYSELDNPLNYHMDKQVYVNESTIIERKVLVYDVGHPEDVEQSILDENIEIPNEGNIA